jgi:hypothetical protein
MYVTYSRDDLRRHLRLLKERNDQLSGDTDEDLFPVWTLIVLATGDESQAAEALCGGPNDGGIDALLIDRKHRRVWVVQGKFRQVAGDGFESAKEVRSFAEIANRLAEDRRASGNPAFWQSIQRNARGAGPLMEEASRLVRREKYEVRMIFASLWKFKSDLKDEVRKRIKKTLPSGSTIDLLGWPDIQRLLDYYIHDIAPAVPDLELPIESGELREDPMGSNDMAAWIVTTRGTSIAQLFERADLPLFARNVRRFLGDRTKVNRAIHDSVARDPHHFWYMNNGITITCEDASLHGQKIRLVGAQVINGQQTTRSLHAAWKDPKLRKLVSRTHVSVRIVRFNGMARDARDTIVANIVEATNHQNSVSQADLRTNDPIQIELERELAARGYRYVRKKASPAERARERLAFLKRRISKEEVAQAVAGALHESVALRKGQTPLFDRDGYYDEIFSKNVDFILLCYWLWKTGKSCAYGNTGRQSAKFMVHYDMFQEVRGFLAPRARRFIHAMELNDPAVRVPVTSALDSLFVVALRSFRDNRTIDGKRYEVKPYFQSSEVDAYARFKASWDGGFKGREQARFTRALSSLEAALIGPDE